MSKSQPDPDPKAASFKTSGGTSFNGSILRNLSDRPASSDATQHALAAIREAKLEFKPGGGYAGHIQLEEPGPQPDKPVPLWAMDYETHGNTPVVADPRHLDPFEAAVQHAAERYAEGPVELRKGMTVTFDGFDLNPPTRVIRDIEKHDNDSLTISFEAEEDDREQ
jgi:hypothetical protein